MDKLKIRGGHRLLGTLDVSGAKNAALPELCAALLSAEPVTLANVPRLQDVSTMLKLIRNMGVTAEHHEDGRVTLNAGALNNPEAPYELVKTMRASVLALGPLLARFGRVADQHGRQDRRTRHQPHPHSRRGAFAWRYP